MTANPPALLQISGLLLTPTPWADLLASPGPNGTLWNCPDAPYGPSLVFSDGTYPRPTARGVQYATCTSIAGGTVTFTFPQPFLGPNPPVLIGAEVHDSSGNNQYNITIKSVSLTAITLSLKQAVVAALGLSVWSAAPAGVTVDITVGPAPAS